MDSYDDAQIIFLKINEQTTTDNHITTCVDLPKTENKMTYENIQYFDPFLGDEDSHLWGFDIGELDDGIKVEVGRFFSNKAQEISNEKIFFDVIAEAVALGRASDFSGVKSLNEGDEITLIGNENTDEEDAIEQKLLDTVHLAQALVSGVAETHVRRVKRTKIGGTYRERALQRYCEKRRRRKTNQLKQHYVLRQKIAANRPRERGRFVPKQKFVNPWFP